MTIKVLCSVDFFLPGFAGGGPIRSIANLQSLLAGTVELSVFTRDRDLGATSPYEGIVVDDWSQTNQGRVFYASPRMFGVRGIKKIMEQEQFDLLYLNSFFSPRSSIALYLWSRWKHADLPIIIAPRGEFSLGALSLKRTKKSAYLNLVRALNIYQDVHWHASTKYEKEDIARQFPKANTIHVAQIHVVPDPVTLDVGKTNAATSPINKDNAFRIGFISRISPMKNLDGLLRMLATLKCPTQLDIFGPIEDRSHWKTCEDLIETLPPHVKATYMGPLAPESVSGTFASYDIFAFPTLGENFGHVIFESLRAGTPVLVSDRTPWRTTEDEAVIAVPLEDIEKWRAELHRAAARTEPERAQLRVATKAYAREYSDQSDTAAKNIEMFSAAINAKRT